MTLTDLNAMLRLQLEHYGFLPLWELLDSAITPSSTHLEVSTPAGLRFKWQDDTAHSFFETFDWWALHGAGVDKPAGQHQLQTSYVDWTREYRRYLAMLSAHGVRVSQHLAGLEDTTISDSFLLEESSMTPQPSAAPVTSHSADDLGTIAVTVVTGNRQMNFYPLQASGLNDLHQFIREQDYAGDVAYPGRLCYDESSRQLVAETLPDTKRDN